MKRKRGRKGEKWEDTCPVWVVQPVGVLFWMGGQRMKETVRAAVTTAGDVGSGSRDRGGSSSKDGQGDLAEIVVGREESAVSTNGEQAADMEEAVPAAMTEAAADAGGGIFDVRYFILK